MPAGGLLGARRRARLLPRRPALAARPAREAWNERVDQFRSREPDKRRGVRPDARPARGRDGWEAKLPTWEPGEKIATREACAAVLDAILDVVPGLIGGGADLTGNTGTELKGQRRSPATTSPAASSTSASASTAWARS